MYSSHEHIVFTKEKKHPKYYMKKKKIQLQLIILIVIINY